MNTNQENYTIVTTEDGSPSLFWSASKLEPIVANGVLTGAGPRPGEMMHHKGGALSESQEIYGKIVAEGLEQGLKKIISVGLGLGYNELIVAQLAIRYGIDEVRLLTYEIDNYLSDSFIAFLRDVADPSSQRRICPENNLFPVYQKILSLLAPENSLQVCQKLLSWYQRGSWQMRGCLDIDSLPINLYNIVLYDAFSAKTSPHLWSEEFLSVFMKKTLEAKSLFSTYACTGSLKRSLKSQKFEVVVRDGFHGKRNSTLGRRGF